MTASPASLPLWQRPGVEPAPTREGNTVVVAGRGVVVPAREELAARAALIEMRDLVPWACRRASGCAWCGPYNPQHPPDRQPDARPDRHDEPHRHRCDCPAASWNGRCCWRWLREDGWISAEDARPRDGALPRRCFQPACPGAPGGCRPRAPRSGQVLDTEVLTEWLAGRSHMAYLRIDPLRVDVGRVADVMSVQYAQSRNALPITVGATEVVVATAEPFDVAWVSEIEAHTRRHVKLVVANPDDLRRYTTEFYALARSVRAAQKSGEVATGASFEQLVELGRSNRPWTPTTRAWCRWWTGCGSTPSTSAPATSTSSRAATWAPSAFASTACCTPSTRCR
jgi:hypothetical protein